MFQEVSVGPPFLDTPSAAPLGGCGGAGHALAGWGGPPAGPRSRRKGCSRLCFPQEGEGGQGAAGTGPARLCWKLVVRWRQVDLLQASESPRSPR